MGDLSQLVALLPPELGRQWDAAQACLALAGGLIILCFVTSICANNYSQVDKLWSIAPPLHFIVMVAMSKWGNARLMIMTVLAVLWGTRMTLNFARRGGYQWPPWRGDEDYRWEYVRAMLRADRYPIVWQLFNATFICFYQLTLLMLLALPGIYVLDHHQVKLNEWDWVLTATFLALLTLESVADGQQFAFFAEKYRRRDAGEPLTGDYKAGFLRSGLFSICRHPNYAAEQAMWIVMYMFALNVACQLAPEPIFVHWTGLGALLLVLLFYPSSLLSESITASKYADYAAYQRSHCRFFPFGSLFALPAPRGKAD